MHSKVVIIGAGPGGVYAALSLAKQGIPSTLMDKSVFPRNKACGDILTSNVLRALHTLNPRWTEELLAQPWVKILDATAFVSPKGDQVVMPFNSPSNVKLGLPSCVSAKRADFDAFLLEKARQETQIEILEGVWVKSVEPEGERYRILTDNSAKDLEADYVVLACGGNSRLVKDLLPAHKIQPKHTAVGYRAYFAGALPAEGNLSEFFLFEQDKMPGGLYVTPFADGSVNVNLVMRYDVYMRDKVPLPQVMEQYLSKQPKLKDRFRHAQQSGGGEGATLFFGTIKRPLSREGLLVVGDAGGLTDATNANGIGHAMISGGIAAETLAEAMQAGQRTADWMRRYDERIEKRLQNALYPGKVMQVLFGNKVLMRLSNAILNRAFRRINSNALSELVYSPKSARTLLNPAFYLRLFSKEKG